MDAGKRMHYVLHAKWSEKGVRRRNILNGREITLNFRQNRLMLAILEFLSLFGRWKTYALRSAFEME